MSSYVMALSALVGGGAEFAGAAGQSAALRQQGKWAEETADFNARMMELQATDATRRGEAEAALAASRGRQVVGAQKAAYAASGVDVASGSALDVANDSEFQAQLDVQKIRQNAWRSAWGLTSEAELTRQQGRMARLAGNAEAEATMLTGGLKFASGALRAYDAYEKGAPTDKGVYKTARASALERKLWEASL